MYYEYTNVKPVKPPVAVRSLSCPMPTPPPAIQGIVPALVTPLQPDGSADLVALARLISQQLAAGVHALFFLGSVGEGVLLRDEDYRAVATCAVREVAGRVPVLAGASENSIARCSAKIAFLQSVGVDAAVCTLPYYGWPAGAEPSLRFFRELASRSALPLIAYNLPKAVGWQMPPEVLLELANIKSVIAIKDTHGDADKMITVAAAIDRRGTVTYLPGNSTLAIRLFAHGANGVVSTPANVLPEVFVTAWNLHRAGRTADLERLDREVMPLVNRTLDLMPTGAAALKGILACEGRCHPTTVAPWPEMDAAAVERSREVLTLARAAFRSFIDHNPTPSPTSP